MDSFQPLIAGVGLGWLGLRWVEWWRGGDGWIRIVVVVLVVVDLSLLWSFSHPFWPWLWYRHHDHSSRDYYQWYVIGLV